METIGVKDSHPAAIRQALHRAAEVATSLIAEPWLCHDLLRLIVRKIVVAPQEMILMLSRQGLCDALSITTNASSEPADTSVRLSLGLRRRGVEARLIIGGGEQRSSCNDRKLVESVAQARQWMERLRKGQVASVADIAREVGLDDGEISRIFPLAFLAPDIIAAILSGRQPVELTATRLKRLKPLPLLWADQRKILRVRPSRLTRIASHCRPSLGQSLGRQHWPAETKRELVRLRVNEGRCPDFLETTLPSRTNQRSSGQSAPSGQN